MRSDRDGDKRFVEYTEVNLGECQQQGVTLNAVYGADGGLED